MERITKIAENNIEVETVVYDKKVNGKEIVLSIESYGQNRLDEELISANAEKARWQNLTQADKDAEIAKADKKLSRLNKIKTEMEK